MNRREPKRAKEKKRSASGLFFRISKLYCSRPIFFLFAFIFVVFSYMYCGWCFSFDHRWYVLLFFHFICILISLFRFFSCSFLFCSLYECERGLHPCYLCVFFAPRFIYNIATSHLPFSLLVVRLLYLIYLSRQMSLPWQIRIINTFMYAFICNCCKYVWINFGLYWSVVDILDLDTVQILGCMQ